MGIWSKTTSIKSTFRRLQLENWKNNLSMRITRAQAVGNTPLLKVLKQEQDYLQHDA